MKIIKEFSEFSLRSDIYENEIEKVKKNLENSETLAQFKVAYNYFEIWFKKWYKRTQSKKTYRNDFSNDFESITSIINEKLKELVENPTRREKIKKHFNYKLQSTLKPIDWLMFKMKKY